MKSIVNLVALFLLIGSASAGQFAFGPTVGTNGTQLCKWVDMTNYVAGAGGSIPTMQQVVDQGSVATNASGHSVEVLDSNAAIELGRGFAYSLLLGNDNLGNGALYGTVIDGDADLTYALGKNAYPFFSFGEATGMNRTFDLFGTSKAFWLDSTYFEFSLADEANFWAARFTGNADAMPRITMLADLSYSLFIEYASNRDITFHPDDTQDILIDSLAGDCAIRIDHAGGESVYLGDDGDLSGKGDAAVAATDGNFWALLANGNYALETDGGVYVDGETAGYDVKLGVAGLAAVNVVDGSWSVDLCNGTYAISTDGGIKVDGFTAGYDTLIGTDDNGGVALQTTDGNNLVELSDGTYAIDTVGGIHVDAFTAGHDTYIGTDDNDGAALKSEGSGGTAYLCDGTYAAKLLGQGMYVDGYTAGYDTYIGTDDNGACALKTTDGTRTVQLSDGTYAIEAAGGDSLIPDCYGERPAETINSASKSPATSESGEVYVTTYASGTVTYTLPSSAADGTYYTVIKRTAQNLRVQTSEAGVAIADSGTGDTTRYVQNTTAAETYATLTLMKASSMWVVVGSHGTWSTGSE